MKRIILFMLLFPVICNAQEQVSTQIYGFNMPIDLDNDTTYYYQLDNSKCTESLFGVDENGGCNYMDSYPYLYFYHQFSLNCCTDHFYEIKVKGDSIFINQSDTGQLCTCGSCTYELTYSDQNPQKNEYHVFMVGKDTTVSKLTNIDESAFADDINVYFNTTEDLIYVKNEKGEKITISLIDMNGKIILSNVSTDKQSCLNVNKINSGIYIVKVDNGLYFRSEKIILEK